MSVLERIIEQIGAPARELCADGSPFDWVKVLCTANGALALLQFIGEARDRALFKTKGGERKVASFSVMNLKYVGSFRVVLTAHIASGAVAQLGSSLAIALETACPELSRRLARVAAAAEACMHAPTAIYLSPFVYGDKGITPYLYGIVSLLLLLSGMSAYRESTCCANTSKGPRADGKRPELRRMCTTISIFLYVRLFAVMRGPGGILQRQKYTLAVLMAGTAMMPVGWQRSIFPAYFWFLMIVNRRTATETVNLVHKFGVDEAAKRQAYLA